MNELFWTIFTVNFVVILFIAYIVLRWKVNKIENRKQDTLDNKEVSK